MFAPKSRVITIDGICTPIDPDFRLMCEYADSLAKGDRERLCDVASRFYFAGLPEGVSDASAAEAMASFYTQGLSPKRGAGASSPMRHVEPAFDFAEDEVYFYADFMSNYKIDLNTAHLHWLDFCALFRGLPDSCKLKQIIGIRTESLSDIKSAAEKARIRKLKGVFCLKSARKQKYQDASSRDAAIKEQVQRLHEAARREASKNWTLAK